MNSQKDLDGSHRSLRLLEELSRGDYLTQRELSSKLGVALGLVNSYIKNLTSKGYITVRAIPPKRYAYYLTPKGFAEKTRLTYHLLQDFTNLYREARRDFKDLFNRLYREGVKSVVFAGADEVAEIAYISLQEVDIEFIAALDNDKAGKNFFKHKILPFEELKKLSTDCIVITSFVKREGLFKNLLEAGVEIEKIKSIYPFPKKHGTRRVDDPYST
ncbi:MAG: winged helix-turn-helix transcriptional regulator [Nitrospirota bacterium]